LTKLINILNFQEKGEAMHISVNGEQHEFNEVEVSISRLLEIRQVESPEMVAVQINGEFVEMQNYPNTYLKSGDDIEFLYFMGGGSQ
jgi:sulfur carrier protein